MWMIYSRESNRTFVLDAWHYSFLKDTRLFSGCLTRADFYNRFNILTFLMFTCACLISIHNLNYYVCLGFFFFWEVKWGQHVIYIAQWCYDSVPRVPYEFRNSWGILSVSRNCQTSSWIRSCIQQTCVLYGRFFFIRMKYNFYLSSFRMTVLQNHCTPRDIHYFL